MFFSWGHCCGFGGPTAKFLGSGEGVLDPSSSLYEGFRRKEASPSSPIPTIIRSMTDSAAPGLESGICQNPQKAGLWEPRRGA